GRGSARCLDRPCRSAGRCAGNAAGEDEMKANMKRCLAVARALVLTAAAVCLPALAQETVCARVKIEIKQELTLERQAFDAEMRITNTLPSTALERVHVDVWVTDEAGQPVTITTDPNNLSAAFFLRQTRTENIANTDGTGQVAASTTVDARAVSCRGATAVGCRRWPPRVSAWRWKGPQ